MIYLTKDDCLSIELVQFEAHQENIALFENSALQTVIGVDKNGKRTTKQRKIDVSLKDKIKNTMKEQAGRFGRNVNRVIERDLKQGMEWEKKIAQDIKDTAGKYRNNPRYRQSVIQAANRGGLLVGGALAAGSVALGAKAVYDKNQSK